MTTKKTTKSPTAVAKKAMKKAVKKATKMAVKKAATKTEKVVKNTVVRPKPFTSWRPDRPPEDLLEGMLVVAGGGNLLSSLLHEEKICLKTVKAGVKNATREIKEATKEKSPIWLKRVTAEKTEDERSIKMHTELVSLLTKAIKLYKTEQHW